MDATGVLLDSFGRIRDLVHAVVDGLTEEQLTVRLDDAANTVGWLVWHLTRVQDDHVAAAAELEQVWAGQGWADRFALPFDVASIGYGHSRAEVAEVRIGADLLVAYHDAVHSQTAEFLRTVSAADLDRVVDHRWDPPVTLGMRLVSVVSDDLQHVGQAAFVRGIVLRR